MLKTLFFATIFMVALGQPAHAYLDPGTGSILFQILLGGAAGALAVLKLYWGNIRALFARRAARPPEAPDAAEDDEKSTPAKP